ncbi:unnamed protein product [Lota lota]
MQEHNVGQPPQLLRESYLAEARAQQRHSDMSRSDSSSSRRLVYGSLKGKVEDPVCHDEPQGFDLSAFLSQEELDKSVNLACQAIGHKSREEKVPAHTAFRVDTKLESAPALPANGMSHSKPPCEAPSNDPDRSARSPPSYGVENQSKKEFLNKAADFIEELSSLFKANSTKRVRPRSCKTHKSRTQNKSQSDGLTYSLGPDDRDRPVLAAPRLEEEVQVEVEEKEEQEEEEQEEEEQEEEAGRLAPTDPPYSEDPVCEPPCFIQKLKSREVLEGSKVQLDCIVTGLPVPEVRWFCEGKELENSPDIQILTHGERHSLIIAEAFEEDTGRYSCFASNFYGTDSTSAEIYVEGDSSTDSEGEQLFEHVTQNHKQIQPHHLPWQPSRQPALDPTIQTVQVKPRSPPPPPPSQQHSSHLSHQEQEVRPIMAAPVFTKSLQEVLALEGQLVVLECRMKGVPSPRVEWYREGTVIEDSPDFRILQKKPRSPSESEEICTLVIAEVFPEDSGMFTCTASNKYGTVSSIGALRVKGTIALGSAALAAESQTSSLQAEQEAPKYRPALPDLAAPETPMVRVTPAVVPLPNPPANSCLKTSALTNSREPRSGAKAGLRVHFRLPEDEEEEQCDASCWPYEDASLTARGPPPVLTKPKLDPAQLQILHNQVLLEQQQDGDSHSHSKARPHTLSSLQEITSPTPMLRSTHASLMNLAATSQSFNHARPKEFVAAQPLSPVRSPSPTESPVPLLNELAAELNSSAASSPTIPPFSPPPRVFPTRVLQSPTSPLSMMSSPTLISAPYLNSVFAGRTQSPPHASSPASSSSTPSPIQNPVAFLSSVLPSLHIAQATNSMGLPKSAPAGQSKRLPKSRIPSSEDIRASKEVILNDIERRRRFNDNSSPFGFQQAYKVSNFEQRLMSEIEFRLERTPVEESDDEVHHDEVPTGRCIAPIFDKKLKNFRAMEGVPVTFSCKLVGIPIPKVYWFKDGKQILRKNDHYKKIREGDGTCALHIDCTTNDDDGNYTVMAANPQGRISCSGHLIVQTGASRNRMTPIHSQRVRTRIQEVEEGEYTQERFFQPHFLQAPGDMLAHEGRLCRLECKVSGLPNPELMWLVNGKPIYPDIFHRMLVRENGVHSLVIDPVVQNHAGVYTCIASNKAGQSSFCLDLKVLEKEVKQPPHFVEKLQNTGIPEGNPARLECRVSGMPPPALFWKKDNDTIPRTKDRFSMHQDATGYVCLLIQPTRKEDAGWYTVSAKNEAGIVSCTSRLDIYAQWHQSIPTPMKKAPRTGSRYAALTGQGLDIKSVFPSSESGPILFASSPLESKLESEEL